MHRALLTALVFSIAVPATAQEAASPPASTSDQDQNAPSAPAMSPEQIAAFNQAVADFNAGQQAQQGGDNMTALAKYEAALPAVRDAVKVDPANLDYVNFLANALYAAAAANAALQKMDAIAPLYEESAPYWRQVVKAKPADAQSRMVLTSILTQLGNVKLIAQDKVGAAPYYTEAVQLARKSVAEKADAANRNMLLSALVGASQASEDPAIKAEAATLSKAMLTDGTVDAINKPAAEILSQSAKAQ
ncbi:MAG: hypothetical protein EP321_03170 [Sphingomonadales bacterium]|nr:MAG: hypothetical protein EP345_09210 [Sphingomonadales bacterium]TNF05501.1 MAG: hypothetical protein EP321_03170 [Sphingomonadales bacterium]